MRTSLTWLRWSVCWVGLVLLAQPSCETAERSAIASESTPIEVSVETSCELGELESVSRCGGTASCHICARLERDDGVCVQPCMLGGNDCPSGLSCRPIGELRDAGGYARIGDCPAGYCR